MRWTVVIPVKALPTAKSRLARDLSTAFGAAGRAAHADLVAAMRADTVAAVRAAPAVRRVLFVADRPGAVRRPDRVDPVVVQVGGGLNRALEQAWLLSARQWPADGTAVLVGDLPAARTPDVDALLDRAAGHARSFAPDLAGAGTTMLAVAPGVALRPAFGPGSACAHAARAVALSAPYGLRADIDCLSDLLAAAEVVGANTARALGPLARHGTFTRPVDDVAHERT